MNSYLIIKKKKQKTKLEMHITRKTMPPDTRVPYNGKLICCVNAKRPKIQQNAICSSDFKTGFWLWCMQCIPQRIFTVSSGVHRRFLCILCIYIYILLSTFVCVSTQRSLFRVKSITPWRVHMRVIRHRQRICITLAQQVSKRWTCQK